MISGRSVEELAQLRGPLAVSVGVFDGVHRGHRSVLAQLQKAAGPDRSSLVVTLDPHPLAVLHPEAAPVLLSTASERVHLLSEIPEAPHAVFVHPFNAEVAARTPEQFLRGLVPEHARMEVLVIGYDFRMGRDRSGGFEELQAVGDRLGFSVVQVRASQDDGAPVSSTRIRELIAAGEVREAAELLSHPYRIEGEVVTGRGIGRTLDFPTANVDVGNERKLLPGFGVYAVRVQILAPEQRETVRMGVLNYGVRPTFGDSQPVLEVHLPGFDGDLGGKRLAMDLIDRIREERQFEGPRELADRIAVDIEEARKILQERS